MGMFKKTPDGFNADQTEYLRSVPCTYCKAEVGEPCVYTYDRPSQELGTAYKGSVMKVHHSARIRLFHEQDNDDE